MKFASLILALSAVSLYAVMPPNHENAGPPPERTRLYDKSDPACAGGIRGRLVRPEVPLEQILAIPADLPENVYEGAISGPKRDSFEFRGLPPGKYDLIAIFAEEFYEGCKLTHDANSLTPSDLQKINDIIQKSEPYFTKKVVHRAEGETGQGNLARCICTFLREKSSALMLDTYKGEFSRADSRRTFKLVILKDVGPGWQVTRARDLYPVWVKSKNALPQHHFSEKLSQIRVADEIKDIGTLSLTQ